MRARLRRKARAGVGYLDHHHRAFAPAGDAHLVAAGIARRAALERLHRVARDIDQHAEQLVGVGVRHEAALDRADPAHLRVGVEAERLAHLLNQGIEPNSDYFPLLDLGAERRRFRHDFADGFPALSTDWFNLIATMRHRPVAPTTGPVPALPENPRVRAQSIGALIRSAAAEGRTDTIASPVAAQAVFLWRQWQAVKDHAPSDWEMWVDQVNAVDRLRNGGTAGVADESFDAEVDRTMQRYNAPAPARDVIAFRRGLAAWRFSDAAAAADRLLPVAMKQHRWITADELRDGAVFAKLYSGDISGARQVLDTLAVFSTRKPGDLRSRLLSAYVTSAELQRAMASR